MSEKQTGCQTCKHWHRTNVGAGECRAHPPTIAFIINGSNVAKLTAYPERRPTDPTCSELARRFSIEVHNFEQEAT
jgi:hypothetical protein